MTKFINADGELREAQRGFDQAATVGNRIRLAQALLGKGDAPGAAAQFRECAQGAFTKDLDVLYGLADAEFACGNAPAAATAMQTLFQHHAARNSGTAALLFARVLAVAHQIAAKKIGCGKRVRHCLQSTRRDSEANKYVTVADFFGYQLFGATTVSSGLDAYLSLLSGKNRGGWLVSLI